MPTNNSSVTITKTTYSLFIKLLFLYLVCCFGLACFMYHPAVVKQDFFGEFLLHQTLLNIEVFGPLFLWFFIFLNYALFFKNEFIYISGEKRAFFYQLISAGLNLVIICAVLYFLALEFFMPVSRYHVDRVKNQSELANILLQSGDAYYRENQYQKALDMYENYQHIVKPDRTIRDRMRTLKLAILSDKDQGDFPERIPDTMENYIDIADYYYEKGNYFAAWYYYEYVGDSAAHDKKRALERIDNIKKILAYRNSLMNDADKAVFIDTKTAEIKQLYRALIQASVSFNAKEYLGAYYQYRRIYQQYPSLRDAQNGMENSISILKKNYTDQMAVENARLYPGHKNFVFFYTDSMVIKAAEVKKSINLDIMKNEYLFYDVRIYTVREGRLSRCMYTKYAQLKDEYLSLISFAESDEQSVLAPVMEKMTSAAYEQLVRKLSIAERQMFDSMYHEVNGEMVLKKLSDLQLHQLGALYRTKQLFTTFEPDFDGATLPFNYSMDILYNLAYTSGSADNFSIFQLLKLKKFYDDKNNKSGFSSSFIAKAIAERIAKVFILFSSSLLLLALCFRYRVREYRSYYVLLIPFALIIMYLSYMLLMYFNSLLMTIASGVLSLTGLALFAAGVNMVLLAIIMIYAAGTKV